MFMLMNHNTTSQELFFPPTIVSNYHEKQLHENRRFNIFGIYQTIMILVELVMLVKSSVNPCSRNSHLLREKIISSDH